MAFSDSFPTVARMALVGLAVGIGTVVVLYGWFSSEEDSSKKKSSTSKKRKKSECTAEVDSNDEADNKRKPVGEQSSGDVLTADGFTVLKLNVPKESVGTIIGKRGVNIKEIQGETKTKIDFDSSKPDAEERVVTIRGGEKGAQDAELRILHIVYGRKDKESHKIQVPQGAVGYIIGAGGENITAIQAKSNCRVKVDPSSKDRSKPLVDITLTGSDEQVAIAAEMIGKSVSEWKTKGGCSRGRGSRTDLRSYQPAPAILPGSPLACESWSITGEYVPCYVTAVANPTEFWVQFITPNSTHLEGINSRLSSLYSDATQLVDDISTSRPPVGTIVAAKSMTDNLWFRGRVSEYSETGGEGGTPAVDVYFVDYGDSCWLPIDKNYIQLLRPEFYTLPAQAVKCLTPLYSGESDQWTDELCDVFEKLAHVGAWRQLMGCLLSWKEVEGVKDKLPVIKLVDTNTSQDTDLMDEMLKMINSEKGAGNTAASTVETAQINNNSTGDNTSHSTVPPLFNGAENSLPSSDGEGTTPRHDVEHVVVPQPVQFNGTSEEELWD